MLGRPGGVRGTADVRPRRGSVEAYDELSRPVTESATGGQKWPIGRVILPTDPRFGAQQPGFVRREAPAERRAAPCGAGTLRARGARARRRPAGRRRPGRGSAWAPRPSPAPAPRCRRSAAAPDRCRRGRPPRRRPRRRGPRRSRRAACRRRATLTRTCGRRVITPARSASGRPVRAHPLQDVQRGQDAVAGRGVLAHDHVAGLLPTEGVAAGAHRLEHVAVADGGLQHADPVGLAGPATRPRLLITVATRVSSTRCPDSCIASARIDHQLVAVDDRTGVVDGQAAVGVAVDREAGVGAVRDDGLLERPEVGGAAAVVDVEAVGLGADRDDSRRRRPAGLVGRPRWRRRWRSRARR